MAKTEIRKTYPLFVCITAMATVLITGGTGLIGTALTHALISKGYGVVVLTRDATNKPDKNIRYAAWDIGKGTIDEAALQEADFIVHLAGANVAGRRWTKSRKKEIRESRTGSSTLIAKALKEIPNKVQAVVSASAIGWYGPDPQIPNPRPFRETDPPHNDFLGQTCVQWEESIRPAAASKRLVILRTGIVLSSEGGAYKEFKKPLGFGVAAVLGSGNQVISWIHIDDLVQLYIHALESRNMEGVFNAVAPHPVSNRDLITAMAAEKKIAVPMPVPEAVLKIMLGEMSIEVLKSTTVSAAKTIETGFRFLFHDIWSAAADLNDKAS